MIEVHTDLNEVYINGRWVPTVGTSSHSLISADSEEHWGTLALSGRTQVEEAISAALAAFPDWSSTPSQQRVEAVRRIQAVYARRADDMASAISREMGAPIDFARTAQVGLGTRHLTAFLNAMEGFQFERMLGEHAPGDRLLMTPIGVAGLITPWNWPMNQIVLKVVAALLAGCTVVLKPSEMAPLSANLFAEILDEAGLPKGVFNLIHGDGAGAGTALSEHPDVQAVSFTGSTRAGKAITLAAAPTLKRVLLELGGKGANLVFADADPMAVERGVRHCFNNSGQSCNAPARMLIERSLYQQAVDIAARVASEVVVGPSTQPGAHIGPVISERQYRHIQSLIETGIAEGARLVAGGPGRAGNADRGFFVRPTVFADVTNDMTIAREEIFGPVLCMMPFDSEEEAIRIANDTPYGLTNYAQTEDVARRRRLAWALEAGMIEMNGNFRALGSPFGGMKQSGRAREGGRLGIEEFLEVKAVTAWV